jgi:hypothetical protein
MVTKQDKTTGGFAAYGCYNGKAIVADGMTRAEAMASFIDMVAKMKWKERRA